MNKKLVCAIIGASCIFGLAKSNALLEAKEGRPMVVQERKLKNDFFKTQEIDRNEKFSDNEVLVVLNEESSSPIGENQSTLEDVFIGIEYESICSLNDYGDNEALDFHFEKKGFKQILLLTLKERSKDNVIKSI